jgi:pimeloyl-ACP methyl ester carboxylesterase
MKKLILLHGALGDASLFQAWQEPLKKKFQCYSFNFSGHGKKPFDDEGFGIEVFADELRKFINSNKLKGADVFGYSMGGYVALYLASLKPELIGKITTLGTKFNWTPESAEQEVEKLNPELIIEKVPAYAKALAEKHGKKEWKTVVWQTAGMMLELGDEPLLTNAVFATIPNKVNILLGDEDNMVTKLESENTAKALPNGSFKLLPKTVHPLEKIELKTLESEL